VRDRAARKFTVARSPTPLARIAGGGSAHGDIEQFPTVAVYRKKKARDTMKLLLGLVLVGAGMAAVFYYSDMFRSPSAECEKTMARMQKCSTMAEVLAVAEPDKVSIYEKETYTFTSGQTMDEWKPGPEVDFHQPTIEQAVKDGSLGGGFAFIYVYSNSDSFEVKLDAAGKVERVEKHTGVRGLPGN
jgi:hypothetical protein